MFSKKQIKLWALPMLMFFAALFITACSESSDDAPIPDPAETPFVVSMAIQGSDNNFTYYSVPFADVMTGTLSAVGQGIEQPGYYDFKQIDNTIYSIGGLDDVNVVGITKNDDGSLSQVGDISFDNSLSDIVKADDNTLVALELSSTSDQVKFHTIDINTVMVKETFELPVSDLVSEFSASYAGMVVSGNYLYLAYYVSDPATYNTPSTEQAEIAVYSYPELEFQKIMTDDRVGPIGGFNVKSGLIKTENGDVYAVSHSNPANGYSQSTKPSGILRIKSGNTEFDQDYFFEGLNTAHMVYLGNGKVFCEINVAERADQERWSDGPLQSAVIDLGTKSIIYIQDVPEHAGQGRRLAALHDGDFMYMCVPEETGIFVYKMDLNNYTATKGAEVEANFVAGFFKY